MIGLEIGISVGVLILSGIGKLLWDRYEALREELEKMTDKHTTMSDKVHEHGKDLEYLRRDVESYDKTTNVIFEILDSHQKNTTSIEKTLAKNQIV